MPYNWPLHHSEGSTAILQNTVEAPTVLQDFCATSLDSQPAWEALLLLKWQPSNQQRYCDSTLSGGTVMRETFLRCSISHSVLLFHTFLPPLIRSKETSLYSVLVAMHTLLASLCSTCPYPGFTARLQSYVKTPDMHKTCTRWPCWQER